MVGLAEDIDKMWASSSRTSLRIATNAMIELIRSKQATAGTGRSSAAGQRREPHGRSPEGIRTSGKGKRSQQSAASEAAALAKKRKKAS
jgi:hypothetical protein